MISFVKRRLGKDNTGDYLWGHGGMLDRTDSLLAATPVVSLYWFFLAPVQL